MSRSRLYWTLQITGWSLYALLGVAINYLFFKPEPLSFLYQFAAAGMMLLSTHFFRYLMKTKGWLSLKYNQLLLRLLPLIILAASIINFFNSWYMINIVKLFTIEEFSVPIYFLYVLQTTIYFSLWTGIYLGVHYFRNYKQQEIEKWKLESAVKDAELIALKAQINPHFLFNALNNIRALILEDHMKARDMVSHLSELLRYSIQFNSNEKVTIWEELDIVEKYLELETIHYEDRLKFEIKADKDLRQYKIPPMILQLMAENAVKHGISQVKGGGEISIEVKSQQNDLVLQVKNTGELIEKEGKGIGLKNALERIRLLFEKEPSLELEQEGDQVKSTLKLPLIA